jgi:outer membrane receptor protein involved in Fe transport
MLKKSVFTFFFFLTIIVNAQHLVSGVIHDENNQLLKNLDVELILENDSWKTKTNNDGEYKFENVPNGEYQLKIYKDKTEETYFIYVEDKNLVFNTSYNSSLQIGLDEVQVQRKTDKQIIETQGFAVNVIETKEAATRNLQINELLDRSVGLRVRQNGGFGSAVEYNLNGMTGRAVGIFIDGIEISTYGSSFNLNNIPPSMIERIEVYKGVLPAHLSGDYLGGAINVIMKKDISMNNLTASASYGSFNTLQSNLSGMYRSSKGLTARASTYFSYTDNDYKVSGPFVRNTEQDGTMTHITARRFNDMYKSYGGRVELGYTNVPWADNFMLGYNGSYVYNQIQHGLYMTQPYKGRFQESNAHVFSLNYNKKDLFIKGLQFNFNGVYSNREQYIEDLNEYVYNWDGTVRLDVNGNPLKSRTGAQQGAKTMLTIDRNIISLRSSLMYDITSDHRVSLTHSYYNEDRKDYDAMKHEIERLLQPANDLSKNVVALNYEANFFNNKIKTNVFGKYYQQLTNYYNPVVQIVNGQNNYTREHLKNEKDAIGYGVTVSYNILPKLFILASAERAVRMPNASEIFGSPGENISQNLKLREEFSNNFNLGFRLDNYRIDDHKFSFSVNGFLRDVNDKIALEADRNTVNDETEIRPNINIGKSRSIGFEAEVNYIYNNNLNIIFNLSKFNSLFLEKESTLYKNQLPNEPFFTMNTSVLYRLNNLIQKESILNLYYSAGYVNQFPITWTGQQKTPTQLAQDVGFSYRFPNKKFLVSFDAKNIFDREIYDNYAVQKPGRGFYLKLNYTINKF